MISTSKTNWPKKRGRGGGIDQNLLSSARNESGGIPEGMGKEERGGGRVNEDYSPEILWNLGGFLLCESVSSLHRPGKPSYLSCPSIALLRDPERS